MQIGFWQAEQLFAAPSTQMSCPLLIILFLFQEEAALQFCLVIEYMYKEMSTAFKINVRYGRFCLFLAARVIVLFAMTLNPALSADNDGSPAKALLRQGRQQLDLRRPDQALSIFRQFSAIRSEDPEGYFWQGVAFDEMGQYPPAISAYRESLAKSTGRNMDAAEVRVNLGNVLLKSHLVDDAIAEYRKAIEMDGREWRGHLNLARALIEKKDYSAALEELDLCADLHFNGMQLPYYRAKAFLGLGKTAEAAVQVDKLMQRTPEGSQRNHLTQEFKAILRPSEVRP